MEKNSIRLLRKLAVFVLLVCAAPVAAAIFGVVHDQVSYTIAPEYYTRFKFIQFAWAGAASLTPRAGAAVVGVLATWWVGLFAGVMLATVGLRCTTASIMLNATVRAFGELALIAISVGLLGLAVGWLNYDSLQSYIDWWRPEGLISPRRFFAVGMMHNGSYLGGALGVLIAAARLWRRTRRQASPTTSPVAVPSATPMARSRT